MRESPVLTRHHGIFIFLQFRFKLELQHNLCGYITVFQKSDNICKSEFDLYIISSIIHFTVNRFWKRLLKTSYYTALKLNNYSFVVKVNTFFFYSMNHHVQTYLLFRFPQKFIGSFRSQIFTLITSLPFLLRFLQKCTSQNSLLIPKVCAITLI